jgi:hypothetical protein
MNALSNTAPPKPPTANTAESPAPKSGVANSNAANESAAKGRPTGERDHHAEVRKIAEVEGEIRDFVRRDVTLREKARPPLSPSSSAAEHMNTVIQRVAGASFDEIDRLIEDLMAIKETLRQEGERVQREISGYAGLSQSAATTMQVIGDSLQQWRPEQITNPRRDDDRDD